MTDAISQVSAPTPPERKKQRILAAAARAFARLGFAKTTVEEIARAAGVSKGLLYVHFPGKEGLFEAVLEQTLQEWHDATLREVEEAGGGVVQALLTLHRASIRYALRHPLLRRILKRDEHLLLSQFEAPGRSAMETWRQELTTLVQEGTENGELRRDLDVARAVDVIRLLHLSYVERLFDYDLIDATDQHTVELGMEALLRGFARQ